MTSVHVWCVDLDAYEYDPATLTALETARAARYRSPEQRRRFEASRAAAGAVLRRYAGPDAVLTQHCSDCAGSDHGEPCDSTGCVSISISRSGSVAAVAVASPDRRIGVDVERVRTDGTAADVAPSLHPDERAALARLEGAEHERAFFAVWTGKEAYVKATGEGLRRELDSFSVAVPPAAPSISTGSTGAWTVRPFAAADDVVGCVLAEGSAVAVEFFELCGGPA